MLVTSSRRPLRPVLRMSELAGIIPRIFWLDPPPTAYQIIVVDWLRHEVDDRAEIKMPVLVHIVGHQNIEVFHYLADTRAYRDAQIAASLYGATL
jgi:hypothetical protein